MTMAIKKTNKQQLLEKASNLFSNQGYHYTSIADIADSCQLSKGSLYHYIDSKHDLGLSVIKAARNFYQESFFTIAKDTTRTVIERYQHMIEKLYGFFIENPNGGLLINLAAEVVNSVPEFVPILQEFFNDWDQAFSSLLESFFPISEATQLSKRILCELQGAVLYNRLFDDPIALTLWKSEYLAMLTTVVEPA